MNSKIYWVIRAFFQKIIFTINSLRYRFISRIDSMIRKSHFSLYILKRVIWDTLSYSLLTLVLYYADSLLGKLLKQEIFPTDISSTIAIIVGGMGICGVILGLYCSNIASVYTQIYTNAPKSISDAFHRDVITNKCIKRITGSIVFGCILLIECTVVRCPYYVSLITWLILLIWAVVTFGVTRNRTYVLSNSYSLSENIYPLIFSLIRKAKGKSFMGKDASFQNHLQKIVAKQLDTLTDIAIYNQNSDTKNNAAMLQFMKGNLNLLQLYWSMKSQIPFDSYWFEDEFVHKQWHWASDYEVQLRVKTGTALEHEKRRNAIWFEERVLEINEICLNKLIKDRDYYNVYLYLLQIGSVVKYAIKGKTLSYWSSKLIKIIGKTIPLCKLNEELETNRKTQNAIVDADALAYIGIILEINRNVSDLNIQSIMNRSVEIADSGIINYTDNQFYNIDTFKKLLSCIKVEKRNEKRRITPNWYIEQMIAKEIFDFCNEVIDVLKNIYKNLLDLGIQLDSSDGHTLAIIALCRFFEMQSKTAPIMQSLESIIPALENKHKDRVIIWDECRYKDFREYQDEVFEKYIKSIICCSESFAMENWNNRENLPDYLGECYNNICECLIQGIEKNDYDRFCKMHVLFLKLTILYKEYIRSDLIKHKEQYLQNRIYYVITAPCVEYAKISSYAIIWGEFINDHRWGELIVTETKKFMEGELGREFIETLPNILKTRMTVLHGIGNRDLVHTDWDQRIESLMRSSDKCQLEYEKTGRRVLKTNSRLIKALCSIEHNYLGFDNPPEDVYIIMCINDLVTADKRYYGRFDWGKEINEEDE